MLKIQRFRNLSMELHRETTHLTPTTLADLDGQVVGANSSLLYIWL